MVSIGYGLLSEEHDGPTLVRNAQRAEEVGFSFALISDHYHPWTNAQGQSTFVWSILGAIAQATERLIVGTGVTCPTMRIHPAIIAQAAATVAQLMPGRFYLGVGSGERLNEHIIGEHWPEPFIRQDMLEEAIEVMRTLWQGGVQSHYGEFFTVEKARIFSLPDDLPPIFLGTSGPRGAAMAGESCDGFIGTSPDKKVIQAFQETGNQGPRIALMHLGYAESEEAGRRLMKEQWPNAALRGQLGQELALPADFEAATRTVREDDFPDLIPFGPDPDRVVQTVRQYVDAGFDHVVLHQVGKDQDSFLTWMRDEVLPKLDAQPASEALGRQMPTPR